MASLVVFKGGSALNSLLPSLQHAFPHASYIVPISDDGGSSREICRVFGGPSIGDLRATLTRLSDSSTPEARAVRKLLEYRLPEYDMQAAEEEWRKLLKDTHPLYHDISERYRGLIRCFLCQFDAERLRHVLARFDLRRGSIGNFFFSGARMVLGSLATAIFVYANVAHIGLTTSVHPNIDTNEHLTIGVHLRNGVRIIGQNEISHPSSTGKVQKQAYQPLPAPIHQLFYLDSFGNHTQPAPNPAVLQDLKNARALLYGVGSLWTSIIPSLVLKGVGEAIATKQCAKIAMLNNRYDRETDGMSALDYIHCLTDSLNRYGELSYPPSAYLSYLFVLEGSNFPIDVQEIEALGIKIRFLPAHHDSYASEPLIDTLKTILK